MEQKSWTSKDNFKSNLQLIKFKDVDKTDLELTKSKLQKRYKSLFSGNPHCALIIPFCVFTTILASGNPLSFNKGQKAVACISFNIHNIVSTHK